MNLAIFDNSEAALAFISAVDAAMGWPDNHGTETYAAPIALIGGSYAVPLEQFATAYLPAGKAPRFLSPEEFAAMQATE